MADDTEISTDHTSIDVEDALFEALKKSMRLRKKLGPAAVSPLPSTCCIFKVPQVLRRHNPKAYQPDVVSIGPYHRHRKQLQRMETVKQWYLRNLLSRMNISLEIFIARINKFLDKKEGIIEFVKRARSFYAEPLVDLNEKEFMEIMILDGCFVIQLLRKLNEQNGEKKDEPILNEEKEDDPILNMDCMFQYICHDLLLLENQLPWFVLSCLYRLTLDSDSDDPSELSELLLQAFYKLNSLKNYFFSYAKSPDRVDDDGVLHILDLVRTFIVFESKIEEEKKIAPEIPEIPEIPPATALSEVGVKFVRGSNKNLTNIEYKPGVLTIPELAIGELTEPLLRNLISFEQCYHGRSHQITSYAIFMDKLISSDKDIELLCKENILSNWLNVEDDSKFFNSLHIDTTVNGFQYHELCAEVKKYQGVKWHRDLEEFRRNYCSSPWKVIALAVWILLLVVNLMQFLISLQSSTLFTGIRVNELSADI